MLDHVCDIEGVNDKVAAYNAIVKYNLEINPVFDDIEEDDDGIVEGEGELTGWSVFNNETGGCWHDHENLHEAIKAATDE
jgi:hypothetical protein